MDFASLDMQHDMPSTTRGNDDVVYRIEKESGQLVVSVFDHQGALLRRIPAEVVLQMARRLERVIADRSLGLHAEA